MDAQMIQNKMGNTLLHQAASIGNVSMCKCIATMNAELVGSCNKKNETPLFLAAHQGKKKAFLCLLEMCGDQAFKYCRRDDGETILHCGIAGEYFGEHFKATWFFCIHMQTKTCLFKSMQVLLIL